MTHEDLIKEIKRLPLERQREILDAIQSNVWASTNPKQERTVKAEGLQGIATPDTMEERVTQEAPGPQPAASVRDESERERLEDVYRRAAEERQLIEARRPANEHAKRRAEAHNGHGTISERLYGILQFEGGPPTDEEVKDMIADYLLKKYY